MGSQNATMKRKVSEVAARWLRVPHGTCLRIQDLKSFEMKAHATTEGLAQSLGRDGSSSFCMSVICVK